MEANHVRKRGSFYLQSKFYRANEMLQEYIEEHQKLTGSTEVPATPPEDDSHNEASQSQSASAGDQKQKQ